MSANERFERYMDHLAAGLGHMDRHAGLKGYCRGADAADATQKRRTVGGAY